MSDIGGEEAALWTRPGAFMYSDAMRKTVRAVIAEVPALRLARDSEQGLILLVRIGDVNTFERSGQTLVPLGARPGAQGRVFHGETAFPTDADEAAGWLPAGDETCLAVEAEAVRRMAPEAPAPGTAIRYAVANGGGGGVVIVNADLSCRVAADPPPEEPDGFFIYQQLREQRRSYMKRLREFLAALDPDAPGITWTGYPPDQAGRVFAEWDVLLAVTVRAKAAPAPRPGPEPQGQLGFVF